MELKFFTRYEKGDVVSNGDGFTGHIVDYEARNEDGVWALVENKFTGERRLLKDSKLQKVEM